MSVNHEKPAAGWYIKKGSFKPKNTQRATPRYQCKACGKTFSSHTTKSTVNQKKPEINQELFKLLVSGVSLRRCAKVLEVHYDTVVDHFKYLAEQCKKAHFKHLKTIKTSFVQVDELETFMHALAKPLSVPMVVRVKTGEILGFSVAKMPARGTLTEIGVKHYGWTADERSLKFQSLLRTIQHCFGEVVTFKSDKHSSYQKWITNIIQHAKVEQVLIKKNKRAHDKEYDELFAINNTFARMRHDMNRLARKTWSTTKAVHGLENHIWLYVAWNNGYKIK